MAAGVATKSLSSSDTRARLLVDQNKARRERGYLDRAKRYMRGTVMSASLVASLPQPGDFNTDQPQSQGFTDNEQYQREDRTRRLQHQIGPTINATVDRRGSDQDATEFDQIKQDYDQRLAQAQMDNQLGLDQRSSAAKRSQQSEIINEGLDQGIKAVQEAVQKRLGSFGMNVLGGSVEGIDTPGEDGWLSFGIAFVRGNLQFARTVVSPAPPPVSEISSLEDIKSQIVEKGLDTVISRLDSESDPTFAGRFSLAFGWIVIGVPTTALILLIVVIVMIGQAQANPLGTVFSFWWQGLSSSLLGSFMSAVSGQ